jgi:hypothetical protein
VTQSEIRAAILQAIRLYLEEQAAAAKKLDERLQTPGTHHRLEPSTSPVEELRDDGNMSSVPVAECVVCMDEKASILYKDDNFV